MQPRLSLRSRASRASRLAYLTGSLAVAAAALAACSSAGAGTSTSAAAGAGSSSAPSAAAASGPLRTESTSLGTVLADTSGMTVYAFAADHPGQSACSGSCLAYWPAVPAPTTLPAHETGLTATLGSITRADGTHQLTVDGYPVYTFAGDKAPGQVKGQAVNGFGGLWWVVDTSGSWVTAAPAAHPSSSSAPASSSGSAARGY